LDDDEAGTLLTVLVADDEEGDEFFSPIFSSHTTGFLLKIGQSGMQIYVISINICEIRKYFKYHNMTSNKYK